MDRDGKRLYLVLFTELYQKSLEDLAVILLALYRRFNIDQTCDYQKKFNQTNTPITHTLINYKIGEAKIKKTTDLCSSEKDIISSLHINDFGTFSVNSVPFFQDLEIFYNNFYKDILAWRDD